MLGCSAGCLCHTSNLLLGDIATPAWGSQTFYLCSKDSPEGFGQISIQDKWSFGAENGVGFGLGLFIMIKCRREASLLFSLCEVGAGKRV